MVVVCCDPRDVNCSMDQTKNILQCIYISSIIFDINGAVKLTQNVYVKYGNRIVDILSAL
jgi:hypothetical protein